MKVSIPQISPSRIPWCQCGSIWRGIGSTRRLIQSKIAQSRSALETFRQSLIHSVAQDEEGLSWKDCETNKHKRHTLRIQNGRGKGDPFLLPQWKIRKHCHGAWERIKKSFLFSPGHQDKDSQTQAIDGWVAKEGMVLDIQQDLCIESQCHQDHLPNEAYDQNGQPLGDVQANILIVHALGGIASISRFLRSWFFGSLILQSPFSGVFWTMLQVWRDKSSRPSVGEYSCTCLEPPPRFSRPILNREVMENSRTWNRCIKPWEWGGYNFKNKFDNLTTTGKLND